MPELPEVETVRRGALLHLPQRRLLAVELARPDLRFPIPVEAVHGLEGRTCTGVRRRSKYLLLDFDGEAPQVALVHLGMSGRFTVDRTRRDRPRPPWRPHEHWRMDFGARLVRYVDPRRFGMLDAFAAHAEADHRLLRNLGPEPLGERWNGETLFADSRGRRAAIKTLLMDARFVVGVGNIYASEACFRAGVRPRRAAGRLSRRECDSLAIAVRAVLAEAIEAGGTTLRDHIGVDGQAGYFVQELAVYGRRGEPCRRCAAPIRHVILGGRATYFCPTCQR